MAAMPDHIPTVKRRARAIEKIFRCYRGDAAMVTDLVRSSITCKTFEALVECLEVIRSDPHTQILQIKNRFDRKYDSYESAGYRNISLSLIIVDEMTMAYGLDTHICELQLGLGVFEKLKHELKGHRRYVKFRDAKGQ